ncbi:MAG: hypothetical protein KAH05_00080, partial [Clostridiales bacterium]|nr:hypothetical protein [Clostridiales bacterium]
WTGEGNSGTEQEFLDSLNGTDGADGADGESGPVGPVGPVGPEGPAGPAVASMSTVTTGTSYPNGVDTSVVYDDSLLLRDFTAGAGNTEFTLSGTSGVYKVEASFSEYILSSQGSNQNLTFKVYKNASLYHEFSVHLVKASQTKIYHLSIPVALVSGDKITIKVNPQNNAHTLNIHGLVINKI